MRVLIVNTSERAGGAAVAAKRLMQALVRNGVQARMMVRDRETDDPNVVGLEKSWLRRWRFLWERFVIFCHLRFSRNHLFEIDIANTGNDITRLQEFRKADIIHLHWINQGMLSLGDIRSIIRSGKPVVWTMHDAWPATAICHIALECRAFTTQCRQCRLLPGKGSSNDLAARVWKKKKKMLTGRNIRYVACSQWLANEARDSALLRGQIVTNIPNPIDTEVYRRTDRLEARKRLGLPTDKRLILFAAQRVTNELKGMTYLIEACKRLADGMQQPPDMVVLGGQANELVAQLPLRAWPLGYISDEQRIVDVYNAVDVFVLPSLSENLPNTIMEAMACGVPCVGFRVGGIAEEIDHLKNGYVAEYRNAADLAKGIAWVLEHTDEKQLGDKAMEKVAASYAQRNVAQRYIEVYRQALTSNNDDV